MASETTRSVQESCHLLFGLPLTKSGFVFKTVSFRHSINYSKKHTSLGCQSQPEHVYSLLAQTGSTTTAWWPSTPKQSSLPHKPSLGALCLHTFALARVFRLACGGAGLHAALEPEKRLSCTTPSTSTHTTSNNKPAPSCVTRTSSSTGYAHNSAMCTAKKPSTHLHYRLGSVIDSDAGCKNPQCVKFGTALLLHTKYHPTKPRQHQHPLGRP